MRYCSWAVLPHTFVLVAVGLWRTVEWVAARRPHWQPARAQRVFAGGLVTVALAAAALQSASTLGTWREVSTTRQAPSTLAAEPRPVAGDVVMSADPGAYRYLWGTRGVITPDDPLPLIERAARLYDVRWLVLEKEMVVPALAPVLRGELRPAWLSAPLVVVRDGVAIALASPEASVSAAATPSATLVPELAIYAVCLEAGDERCAP
jgi:hypothetical protein